MNEQQPVQTPAAYGPPPEREPQPPVLDRFFGWLRSLGLSRDTDDKWLAGICSGIANRLGVDPLVVRAGLVVLVLFGGIGITLYLAAWLLLPDPDDRLLIESALRSGDVVGILLMALVAVTLFGGPGFIFDDSGFWWLVWVGVPIAVVVWLVSRHKDKGDAQVASAAYAAPAAPVVGAPEAGAGYGAPGAAGSPEAPVDPSAQPPGTVAFGAAQAGAPAYAPPAYAPPTSGTPAYGPPPPPKGTTPKPPRAPRPPRPPRPRRRKGLGLAGFLLAIGLSVVAFGAATMLHDANDWSGDKTLIAFAAALGALGLVILLGGLAGRRAGFTGFVAVVAALLTWGAAVVPGLNVSDGVGDRTWTPTASRDYSMGFGTATIQLDQISSGTVDAELGIGELRIEVPEGTTVRVVGSTEVGAIDVRTETFDQFGGARDVPDRSFRNDSGPSTEGERIDQTFGDGPVDVTVDAEVGIGQITVVTP